MGFGNVAEDRQDILTLRCARFKALLSRALLPCLLILGGGGAALAQSCEQPVGSVQSLEGEVAVQDEGDATWRPAQLGQALCKATSIRTGSLSRAALMLVNDEVLRLDQETTLKLSDVPLDVEQPSLLDLAFGAVQSFSRSPKKVNVNTAYMTLAIRGTEFVIRADQEQSLLTVLEGEVLASNAAGEVPVPAGSAAVARAGQAPQVTLVARPRDAVQWSLFYPPIFSAPPGDAPELLEAQRLAAANDVAGALAALERAPPGAGVDTYRASLLLQVGRVDEARRAIDAALAADPQAAQAYALRSIVQVVQNEREASLADAQKAVELDPTSAPAGIALSYAQQANFDLEGARDTLLQATKDQPNDALAWARLGEVRLMLGDRRGARQAAQQAVALAPDLDRTQTVLGFTDLSEIRIRSAQTAFERAIELAPSDPLPRLGLGLARIRQGNLERGRGELDIAVALDPSSALLRTYLGKAYFEEFRDPLAEQQFAIAKELDPYDPTPYLYDAIMKQTQNRPVEALQQLDRSIALNENRAIYRNGLQIDEDRAARGTALARIYDDLGFRELGANEADEALAIDPTNTAAHRLLSDLYIGARRRESARVSELLQAQLFQNINRNPVQPSLSETNLNIITSGGPAEAGFNEFTPLFESNGVQVNATGLVGNENTIGGEGVVTGLYDWASISAGIFYYDTDGWRENNDLKHKIQNVFFQAALLPELNLQLEYRHRDTDQGYLPFNFDRNDFLDPYKNDFTQDTARVGLRFSPTNDQDFLLSFIYNDFSDNTDQLFPLDIFQVDNKSRATDDAYQLEGLHVFRRDWFNLTTGLGYADVDQKVRQSITLDGQPFVDETTRPNIDQYRGYFYGNAQWPTPVTWTLGFSYDDYEEEDLHLQKLNPKAGVRWQVTPEVALRAAAFRYVKPALAANRTIEPTQVAGFDQIFDDANGTEAWRYAIGSDWTIGPGLFAGAEASWRDLSVPVEVNNDFQETNWDEQTHRLYLYWAPLPRWAFTADLVYDRFESEDSILDKFGDLPSMSTRSASRSAFATFTRAAYSPAWRPRWCTRTSSGLRPRSSATARTPSLWSTARSATNSRTGSGSSACRSATCSIAASSSRTTATASSATHRQSGRTSRNANSARN